MSLTNSQLNLSNSSTSFPDRIIEGDAVEFCEKFNRAPFTFTHNLKGHPLFELPRLAKLANTLAEKGRVMYKTGSFPIHKKWSERADKEEQMAEAIANIQTSDSWLLLQDTQLDPEYRELMEQIIAEAEILIGIPLQKEITWLEAFIFIASPHTTTPYHIDSEQNFIFQIHGEKEDNLFDQCDRSVLTEQEIENFYAGELESAIYKEENQKKASVYNLTPGIGIYHPVNAPHWVRNGETYSVSLAIPFYLRQFDLRARIYQANYILRKLGLHPTPPNESALKDSIKINTIGFFSKHQPKTKDDVVRSGINRILWFPKKIFSVNKACKRVIKKSKHLVDRLAKKLPILSDYYRYYICFYHQITACRGIFGTFDEAVKSLPVGTPISHNQSVIHDHTAISELTSCRVLGILDSVDYPIIPWLKSAFAESLTVFDFGGNVGVSYYAFQKHLIYPDNLRWIVCDLPEIVKAGEKISQDNNVQNLSFTVEFAEADGIDILMTFGTLQYVEPSLAALLLQLNRKPRHLLINHLPLYDGETFVTLQNIGYASAFTPYKIQNRTEFINSLVSLGYKLIDTWEWNRTLSIPFHPKRFVSAYHGFYFRLDPREELLRES
jgi:putative methyltransferase (TIGR04325 family)